MRPFHCCFALACAAITLATGSAILAQPTGHKAVGYIADSALGYASPPPPTLASATGQADIKAVRVAQSSDEARQRQAFEDAGAYNFDQLIPRFSQAAGTSLDVANRPILGHMAKLLLIDAGNFVGDAKTANPRLRPYKEDPTILPCQTDYLYPSDGSSYPSGHAANGYVAARLLSEVIGTQGEPDRRAAILARGRRYGDNRVVCGVHHPSDVREGRVVGEHVYDKAAATHAFQADIACAKEENARSTGGRLTGTPPALSPACQAMSDRYQIEGQQKSG